LPEDGPVWPKHVAHKHGMYIYFNDIFKHFNEHFSVITVHNSRATKMIRRKQQRHNEKIIFG
jgi:hypothetical protein